MDRFVRLSDNERRRYFVQAAERMGLGPQIIEVENRSIPRNRGLAKIFHDIGFIEGWGTGFQWNHHILDRRGTELMT